GLCQNGALPCANLSHEVVNVNSEVVVQGNSHRQIVRADDDDEPCPTGDESKSKAKSKANPATRDTAYGDTRSPEATAKAKPRDRESNHSPVQDRLISEARPAPAPASPDAQRL